MSLALQWGYTDPYRVSEGFIYFDAVTSISKTFNGAVSSNPIDGGGLISDHFTQDNPTIKISAVISGVDISFKGRNVVDRDSHVPDNNSSPPEAVKISSGGRELIKFLPDTIGQFFTPNNPSIVLAAQSPDTLQQIQASLEQAFQNPTTSRLYYYDRGNLLNKFEDNLIITSIDFTEDVDSGDGLYCEISLEKVTFAFSESVEISANIQAKEVSQDLKDKAAATENKGTADSTPVDTPPRKSTIAKGIDAGKDVLATAAEYLPDSVVTGEP